MFNFFKKKKKDKDNTAPEEENSEVNDVMASITFFIKEDGSPYVEANIRDVTEENVLLISELLAGLARNEFLESTVELVRDFLIEKGRPELFLVLAEQITALAYVGKTKKTKEEPYIKPSDAI